MKTHYSYTIKSSFEKITKYFTPYKKMDGSYENIIHRKKVNIENGFS